MNNLAYGNQQPEKVGPAVEEKVRKETGSAGPVPYKVEMGDVGETSVRTVLGDMAGALFGGRSNLLFTLVFDISTPRRATLQARVARQGVGCHVEALLYSTQLSKPVKGEVSIENPKTFGTPKFIGDAETAAKLNGAKDLAKRVNKLARTEAEIGGLIVKMPRLFKIVPQDSGSLLVLNTLPRMTSMGMDAVVDAKEFFDIAAIIEAAL